MKFLKTESLVEFFRNVSEISYGSSLKPISWRLLDSTTSRSHDKLYRAIKLFFINRIFPIQPVLLIFLQISSLRELYIARIFLQKCHATQTKPKGFSSLLIPRFLLYSKPLMHHTMNFLVCDRNKQHDVSTINIIHPLFFIRTLWRSYAYIQKNQLHAEFFFLPSVGKPNSNRNIHVDDSSAVIHS